MPLVGSGLGLSTVWCRCRPQDAPVELDLAVLRAQHGLRIQRVTDLDLAHALEGLLHEGIVDGLVDQGAAGARAHLPAVERELQRTCV